MVQENDTVAKIKDKYGISDEMLNSYNDLDNFTVGTKLILPSGIKSDS